MPRNLLSSALPAVLLCLVLIISYTYGFNKKSLNGPLLIYSTLKDIRVLNSSRANAKTKSNIVIKNLTENAAVDFHYAAQKLFWSDHGSENIKCADFNGHEAENPVEIINGDGMTAEGLAVDWYTNKLYWIDSEVKIIEVATTTGQYRKVLFWSDIDQPRAIALAPMRALMFWTDWGDISKIERAGMNGDHSTRQVIVSDNIFWPNGLTIDYSKELIYWVDAKLHFVASMNYDGSNRTKIVEKHLYHPYSLTFFDGKLFWTDWDTKSIYMYYKNSVTVSNNGSTVANPEAGTKDVWNKEPKELIHSEMVPGSIHVWDARRQPPGKSPCDKNNGGCSHLCLLSPTSPGYTCTCPIGVKMIDAHRCAVGPEDILILALRTSIGVIYLDTPDHTFRTIPLNGTNFTIAVDYDAVEDFIYWTDDEVKKIQRAKLDGSQQEVIVSSVSHADGVAVDWVARNIYWTDTGTDHIEVARLDRGGGGSFRNVLISTDLYEPRAIAVAPEHGWMFWTDWYVKNPKIERANLDGTERTLIVGTKIAWPNGVTLDLEANKVYWSDGKTDKIEYANMDGSDRRELIGDNLPHIFGFTILGDFLYWTDWQRRALDRVHKESGKQREVILEQKANMMGLKAIRRGKVQLGKNPCGFKNGGCSQFCFNRHNASYVCACHIDYELTSDGKTCVVPEAFMLTTKKDGIGKISLEYENNNVTLPISGIKSVSAIDYDFNNNRIYWSDTKQKTIMRAFVNGSDPQRVIELGLSSPKDIAVDWIGHNLYWTDNVSNKIEVARLDGSSRRALLWTGIDKPTCIVIDPELGFMYWAESGQRSGRVKRAAMDGSEAHSLLENTGTVTSLALDYDTRRLYWAENPGGCVYVADTSGGYDSRKLLISASSQELKNPVKIALYHGHLYWSNADLGTISRADKATGAGRTVVHATSDSSMDLVVFSDKDQRGTNPCAVNNGGCSHLCLPVPHQTDTLDAVKTHTCACPTHYTLQNNTCLPPKRFMIYSQRHQVVRLLPDTLDCPESVLPIKGLKTIKAVDFDPVNHILYWIENKTGTIKIAKETGGDQIAVIVPPRSKSDPYDLALDSLGRLLFWTCSNQNVVNVTHLNGTAVGVVIDNDGEKPRLLAIHPTKRLLFYTDVGSIHGHQLIRTRLDGSHKIRITRNHVNGLDKEPITAIAVDTENDMIVWTSGSSIYMATIDGENMHVVFNESNAQITQLTVHQGWLYWLDKEIQQLQRLELKTGKSRSPILDHATNIYDLVSVHEPMLNHSCAFNAARCSHICIGNETHGLCACPVGYFLDKGHTCERKIVCGPGHFTCATNSPTKDCIPDTWKCDNTKDCLDGSDEADCSACRPDQYRCRSGDCIELSWLCDGNKQCPDGGDEEKCCKRDEFRCKTDVCIARALVCDGNDNCASGEDETEEVCNQVNSMQGNNTNKGTASTVIFSLMAVAAIILAVIAGWFFSLKRRVNMNVYESADMDEARASLSPMLDGRGSKLNGKMPSMKNRGKGGGSSWRHGSKCLTGSSAFPDVVHMSMISTSTYDRNNITGASKSSTNGSLNSSSLACYPRETLNPPPSPATTAASTRGSSPMTATASCSRYRPYRHYRIINQPPPPTPCSTDVCDESDYYVYSAASMSRRYAADGGPIPPPPTPRSHCHSESCPPSPSSRSSTYFNPLPPPPSPVPSPPSRGYDS